MSILIKGMEVPSSCYDCNCFIKDSDGLDYCCLLMRDICDNEKKEDDCPLIEVPPHGRLIDADAISEDDRQVYGFYNSYDLQQLLDNCPTIIEAEVQDEL